MMTFALAETLRHTTPLIVVCSDAATQRPVTRGIYLTAVPLEGASRRHVAFSAGSGAYAFENLGGLRDLEFGDAGLDGFIASPSPGRKFALFFEDTQNRYLPFGVVLTLPRREPFLALLFAAPSTLPPPGLLLLRGTLTDTSQPLPGGGFAPAAYAFILADYNVSGSTAFVGLADSSGQFALPIPLPSPLIPPPGIVASPSLPAGTTVANLLWPLNVRFQYAPTDQRFLCLCDAGQTEIVHGQRPRRATQFPPRLALPAGHWLPADAIRRVCQCRRPARCVPDNRSRICQRVYLSPANRRHERAVDAALTSEERFVRPL